MYGVPRGTWLKALAAEGIPVSPGYVVPLYKQPLFTKAAFGPFTASVDQNPKLDFGSMHLPVCEQICAGEGSWIYQNVLLGSRSDMDDVVNAFEKVYENREALVETDKAVAAATGKPPGWFWPPYLELDDRIAATVGHRVNHESVALRRVCRRDDLEIRNVFDPSLVPGREVDVDVVAQPVERNAHRSYRPSLNCSRRRRSALMRCRRSSIP